MPISTAQHGHQQEGHSVHTTTGPASASTTRTPPGLAALLAHTPSTPGLGAGSGACDDGSPGLVPCQEHPADLWFAELPAEVEHAKELCGPCPFRVQCLDGAVQRGEPWGVWGGQLLLEGRVVPRKRPRGRPRKSEAA